MNLSLLEKEGMKAKNRVVFVGRFNPFHKGHLEVIKSILAENESRQLIIVIGSSQFSHTANNPFSPGERIWMIEASLQEKNLPMERILVIPVPDIQKNSVWVSHVENHCPPFKIVFSNNDLTIRLFKEKGYTIKNPVWINRDKFSGTEVRRRMQTDENWIELVPPAVIKIIKKIKGVDRLKDVIRSLEQKNAE